MFRELAYRRTQRITLPSQHLVINPNKKQASQKGMERSILGGELPAYEFIYFEEDEVTRHALQMDRSDEHMEAS
jgi:hypothetical protein